MTKPWNDFNDADDLSAAARDPQAEREAIRAELMLRLETVLHALFPAGKQHRGVFVIGDALGSPGRSLEVVLDGEKAGLWTDRAENRGGDIFDLIAAHYQLDAQHDFARVLEEAQLLLGYAAALPAAKPRAKRREIAIDELGPATAKWDYRNADGALLAVVYRYDPPSGKEFRPWDAKRRKASPPSPRPLYNLPGFARSTHIVLVEGEKCAQALIDIGVCATTAMHGANAPVDKTDWSPLAGKHVLIWPDKDKAGSDYALSAGEAVLAAGASSCAILTPPEDRPEGWDAADALAEGFDVTGFLGSGERLPLSLPAPSIDMSAISAVTDDALALAFTRHYGQDWRYCSAWGQWLAWSGTRWNQDRTLLVQHLARCVCRAASAQVEKSSLRAKLASAATVMSVERLVRSDRKHAAAPDLWDRQTWALNTPGGILDLRTGKLRPHDRTEGMTKLATATPRGHCPIWRRFLGDVTGHDMELQTYLQCMAGYFLTGVTSAHALFFLYGTGANGKSVFVNVLTSILGDYAMNAPMETFMETRGDRHPTDLAGLRGARFVAASETEQGRRWNESKLKAITGGDTITARFMRQDFFEYVPQFKLLIAGNHKPAIRNVDEAMKRRLHLIPFTVTIPEERRDHLLTEKLLAERDGILAWALEGCLRWQRDGLCPPESVRAATDEYFDEEDAIGELITDECDLVAEARTPVADIFERWRLYREQRGEYVGTSRWLVQQLITRGFQRVRVKNGVKAIAGLALKPLSKLLR